MAKDRLAAIKHLDFYGKTLGFHYRGQDKMRSCTGATISLIVFFLICTVGLWRLATLIKDTNGTFLRHFIPRAYEGMASTSDDPFSDERLAPQGLMTSDQMTALDSFYLGVGFATDPSLREYDELGFGSWKFYEHLYILDEEGNIAEEVRELETASCFASIDNFFKPSETAKRVIATDDLRNSLKCVKKTEMRRLQVRTPERWASQPRYSF